ncbi:Acyl-CoA dehydrogenase/oxidase, N-terminal [Kalmanozyma brasiliensis GHG001]|uniref:Acyl-CoA dehydrogenase n=1 Tax=Kalmanozyma brasiliensis (strain GHG001) TaxID=1365824 RepID=V5GPW4_KALBG|nr:Acyl-CoA dehydrogenase/oxidase, N-terminal [Kalmanozyma brasiliensis GHG001]EST08002.1 Acyl-CoA dehydrogenase/oxidase, N-terminal [Kalmanozyma brasiliensis GHG001]
MSQIKLTKPTVPFSEAPWIQGLPSSIFTSPSHVQLREWARNFTDEVIVKIGAKYVEAGRITDDEAYQRCAKDGVLFAFATGVHVDPKIAKIAERAGVSLPAGIKMDEWSNIHDYIIWDELNRAASAVMMGLLGGLTYGTGPLMHFCSDEQKERWLPEIFSGKKRICLAITEPLAGSNVANLSTEAKLIEENGKKYYLVNGSKKWITNGIYSDYFTTAVRTSGKAGDSSGISLLLIPKGPGVTTKQMKMLPGGASGTTIVEFDDVKVPVENLIGKEGDGLRLVFFNFNHERMTIAFTALRLSRVCLEDAIAHTRRREVFGKKLIEQPVVRYKIGHMAREVEALQAWVESIVFQQMNLTIPQSNLLTGGTCALLKAHAGIVLDHVVRESLHLLGGMGLTVGGTGERIERIYREVKGMTIPGGSEDVMLDLGVRQQLKLVGPQSKF